MRPFTDQVPKPLLPIHGRPFLEYIVEMLRDQHISRVLLLLGYRAELIQQHFGDGSKWNVEVSYSVTAEDDETGRRLALVRRRLEPTFLLLYADNYWPMTLDVMWHRAVSRETSAMVTVYENRDAITRNNVEVAVDDRIVNYDPSRLSARLNGVEIGYTIMTESALEPLSEANVPFGAAVLKPLSSAGRLTAFRTDHRYYSIGSPERVARAAAFLARPRAVILDRDGVLNRRPRRAEYVRRWQDFHWLPGARQALRLFTEAGFRVVVVTNQPGIARGSMTANDLTEIHDRMVAEAAEAGGKIDRVYACLHGWDDDCRCRKPRPGMLFDAQHDFDLDLTRTFVIGDDERDIAAASAAGSPSRLVSEQMTLLDHARQLVAVPPRP